MLKWKLLTSSFTLFNLIFLTASIVLGCGGTLSGPSGSLTSPSYPSAYHHNAECTWTIRTSKGSKINFVFLDLDLESSDNCAFDYVRIYDGPDRRSKVIGQYCHSMQQPIISTGNTLLVVFRSDYSQGKAVDLKVNQNWLLSNDSKLRDESGFLRSI